MHTSGRAEAVPSSQFSVLSSELIERSMTSGEAPPALQESFQSMEGAVTKVGIWRACTASAGRVQELNPSSIFNAGRRVAQTSAPPRGVPPSFARFSFREGWVAVCSHNGTRPSRRAGRTPLKAASEPPCSAQDDIFRIIAKKKPCIAAGLLCQRVAVIGISPAGT